MHATAAQAMSHAVAESVSSDVTAISAAPPTLLQRTCSCGQHALAGGECEGCRKRPDGLQAKLTVSQPGDEHELEADRVADAVMRMEDPVAPGLEPAPASIGEREEIDRQAEPGMQDELDEDDEDEQVDAKATSRDAGPPLAEGPGPADGTATDVHTRLDQTRGAGAPLPASSRGFFEQRFGQDFSGVRVHADAHAGDLARSLRAQAFARDQDIYFAPGRYQPDSPSGRHLLAHELTHTLQQRNGVVSKVAIQRRTLAGAPPAAAPAPAAGAGPSAAPPGSAPAATAAPAASPVSTPPAAPPASGAPAGGPPAGSGAAGGASAATAADAGAPAATSDGAAAETEPATLDTSSESSVLQSLAKVPVSSFAPAVTEADRSTAEIHTRERTELGESLPEIETPTGLPALADRRDPEATTVEQGDAPAPDLPGPRAEPQADTTHDAAQGPLPGERAKTRVEEPADDESGSWWDWLTGAVSRFLHRLPTSDPALDTSAGERPRVDTTGDADPAQNERQRRASDDEIAARRDEADLATHADFGENDVYPDAAGGTMRPNYTPGAPRGGKSEAGEAGADGAPEAVRKGFDAAGRGHIASKVGEQIEQERRDREDYERDSSDERTETQRQIDDETARVCSEQEKEQGAARSSISGERTAWRERNRSIQERYGTDATSHSESSSRQIDDEIRTSEQRADSELKTAERQAEDKRIETEREAEEQKREVENRPRGFWSRVKGAVSGAFDVVIDGFTKLFDALRAFVREVIERAKRFVVGLIEAARKTIVGLIKLFGEGLKVIVSVALIAFPDAAERARKFIDGRVDGAVDLVNRAARALQAFVRKAFDLLAKVLDAILAFYQAAYLAILKVLRFLALGLVEIMEKIANLVEAAMQMPGHFIPQVTEELVGQDLTQPLVFERTKPLTAVSALGAAADAGELTPEDAKLMSRGTLGPGDVSVDQMADLGMDVELINALNLDEGQSVEFGANSDPSRTLAAAQEEAIAEAQGAAEPDAAAQDAEPDGVADPHAANEPQPGADTDETGPVLTAEEQTEKDLEEKMAQEPEEKCPTQASTTPAGPTSFPEDQKIGPLSPWQRARYLTSQMMKGVRNWFSCHQVAIILGTIAVLTVLVALEVLTGGAITAALPPIMQAIAAVMLGVAAVRMALWIGEYLSKGWAGDIAGAAKSLARGLAVGAIELIFTLLFDFAAVLKVAKQGIKASLKGGIAAGKAGFKTVVQSARRVGRALTRTVRRPKVALGLLGRAAARSGKLVLKGVRSGVARGARSLEELARRLWKGTRFRRFKLVRTRWFLELWAEINPWWLVGATVLPGPAKGRHPELGDVKTLPGGQKAFLIGVKDTEASGFVKDLRDIKDAAVRQKIYDDMLTLPKDQIRKLMINRESTAALRKGITGTKPPHFNAHHIVPRELRSNSKIKGFLDEIGFSWEDGARNGVMLPPNKALGASHGPPWTNATPHFTSHRNYTRRVATELTTIEDAYRRALASGVPKDQARAAAASLVDSYAGGLRKNLLAGTEALD